MSAVSVLILTRNEETDIAGCLDSCAWCDDVVVFDSCSTDRTREIALARGARVIERAFDGYASQRNAALTQVRFAHPWVLMVDADERVPERLAQEVCRRASSADPAVTLFRMRRKDYFMGRWLRRSSGYPTWFGRLVRVGRVKVTREINEEYVTEGRIEHLEAHLHHFPFSKGVAHWIERHNRYSSMEAAQKLEDAAGSVGIGAVLSRDPVDRRRALKRLAYRLPLRPLLVFVYLYVARLGILDGRAGLTYCRLRALYERLIDWKVVELKRRRLGLSP